MDEKQFTGLTKKEARRRLKHSGLNVLEYHQQYSVGKLLINQLTSPLIAILGVAAVFSLLMKDWVDATVILLTVFVNTVLGFWQELKAEKSLEALTKVLSPVTVVMRGGKREEIQAANLVPGDLVLLDSGSKVPADGVLIQAEDLMIDEAVMTGESIPVPKKAVDKGAEMTEGQRRDIFAPMSEREKRGKMTVYSGTTVVGGMGVMAVVATGMKTELGAIARTLTKTEERLTPLQERLKKLGWSLTVVVMVIAVGIFLIGLAAGGSWLEYLEVAVAVAVAAVPEGLVISLTAILAVGMQRILKRKALVRGLVAAEVLGSVSVICSDKTGTLTEGRLTVAEVDVVDEKLAVAAILTAGGLKDPLEVALYEWAKQRGHQQGGSEISDRSGYLDRWVFTAERRFSATLTTKVVCIMGAPEVLMKQSRLNVRAKEEWQQKLELMTSAGLRVVGLAQCRAYGEPRLTKAAMAGKWYFIGLVGLSDPVRRGVAPMLKKAKAAGIGLKVITGDYAKTAQVVLRRLGIMVTGEEIMEGEELAEMTTAVLDKRIGKIVLFARTTPEQKLKIVDSLQRTGAAVAMTGDGVNDAPALKKADIGIVVSSASDVAKETADIVLLDDNFGTIIAAVEEGRGIYHNFLKVILYLLSGAFSEVIAVVGAILVGLPLPLTATQILWVNLVNDGFPTLALTVDPKARGLLQQQPRSPTAPLINKYTGSLVAIVSGLTGLGILLIFGYMTNEGVALAQARTFAFTLLSVSTLLYVFSTRALYRPAWESRIFKNPWLLVAVGLGLIMQGLAVYAPPLQSLLHTVPLAGWHWVAILIMSLVIVGVIETLKWIFFRSRHEI